MYQVRPARKLFASGSEANDSSFGSKTASLTRPSGSGVLDLTLQGYSKLAPWGIKLWPLGVGNANDVYSMRILGWAKAIHSSTAGKEFVYWPTILGEFACTLGAFTGLAGSPIINTDLFCDTITPVAARNPDSVIGAGTAVNSELRILSPANDTPGFIILPLYGFEILEFQEDQTTNTPKMNVAYSFIDCCDD